MYFLVMSFPIVPNIEVKHHRAFLNHHGNHTKSHLLNHFWRHKHCNDLLLWHNKNGKKLVRAYNVRHKQSI